MHAIVAITNGDGRVNTHFSALDAMIRDVVTRTQGLSDEVEVLVSATQLMNASGADPRAVVGSLVDATRSAGAPGLILSGAD